MLTEEVKVVSGGAEIGLRILGRRERTVKRRGSGMRRVHGRVRWRSRVHRKGFWNVGRAGRSGRVGARGGWEAVLQLGSEMLAWRVAESRRSLRMVVIHRRLPDVGLALAALRSVLCVVGGGIEVRCKRL